MIPRRPPLLRASHQELLSPHLSPENAKEGGGERLAGQPNENVAPRSAAPVTPDERWANQNTGIPGATQPQPEASDPTQMRRTAVYPGPSNHSHPFTQPPISTANENSALPLGMELCKFPGLYKPASPDLTQDLTARPFRVNNSGSSLSSPPHLQPYTKPFSGQPARPYMTCPIREAGGALRERSGIVYPLLPRHQRRHRHRPSRSSRCWMPSPAAHGCRDWDHPPAAARTINKETRF